MIQTGTPLNARQLESSWSTFHANGTVSSCMNTLRCSLFGGGIFVHSRSMSKKSESNVIFEGEVHQVANKALDWLMVVGFIPVVVSHGSLSVPDESAVDLFVELKPTGKLVYTAKLKQAGMLQMGQDESESVCMVWTGSSVNLPTASGDLTTSMIKISRLLEVLSFYQERAKVAAYLSTNPLLISSSRDTSNTDKIGTDWVKNQSITDDEGYFLKQEKEVHQEIDKLRSDLHNERCNHWKAGGGMPDDSVEIDKFSRNCLYKEHFLSTDRDFVNVPRPSSMLTELRNETCSIQREICTLMGVPINNSSSVHSNRKGGDHSHMVDFIFRSNLVKLRDSLEKFLIQYYSLLEGFKDVSSSVDVDIPGVLYMSAEEIFHLVDAGVLTHEESHDLVRHNLGMKKRGLKRQKVDDNTTLLSENKKGDQKAEKKADKKGDQKAGTK